jgi:hypothetical protein
MLALQASPGAPARRKLSHDAALAHEPVATGGHGHAFLPDLWLAGWAVVLAASTATAQPYYPGPYGTEVTRITVTSGYAPPVYPVYYPPPAGVFVRAPFTRVAVGTDGFVAVRAPFTRVVVGGGPVYPFGYRRAWRRWARAGYPPAPWY